MMPMPEQSGSGLKIPILFGIVIALLAANVYLFVQITALKKAVALNHERVQNDLQNFKETSNITTQTATRRTESLKSELEAARRRAEQLAGQAREEAMKQVEVLEKKVEEGDRKALQQTEAVKREVAKVEQSASAANTKAAEISTDVGKVRQEVASTKSDLEKAVADLKSVRGDLGVQSGLIATNSRELGALRALGERNYYEFNLVKSKQPVKLNDITIVLKNADLKRNRYTIEIVADDQKVEKKDKNVHEPVQFYMGKYGRYACELVVQEVKKDRIVGYLSQPKVTAARN
jgi:predicted Holliday junction resolvase-like endonuclease